jgi:hypothetical protein
MGLVKRRYEYKYMRASSHWGGGPATRGRGRGGKRGGPAFPSRLGCKFLTCARDT